MPKDSKIKKDPSKNIPRLAKKYPNKPHNQIVAIAMSEAGKTKKKPRGK